MGIEDGWTDDMPWLGQYILDENGDAVPAPSLLQWGQWLEGHPKERHVGLDEIGNARVSTIFLGLDCGVLFLGRIQATATFPAELVDAYKPVLWETMVFGGKHDSYQKRYRSKEEALEGHRKAVLMVKADDN